MDNRTIEEVRKNETKLINEMKVLEQQVKKQKEVIDKAIEYINGQIISYDFEEDSGVDCECDGFKLLDILEGVSNNE